jgi:DNA repair protein RecO (recombination protein O)
MGIHTAEVIVLRRYPFRETSVTLTCLTDRFGKLKGLVKGLRAQPSRHRSSMEPFTVNRIVFYDTRTSQLHLISQCDLVESFVGLQRDLATMQLAALCTDLTDAVVPLEEPQPATYQLLKQLLEHLASGGGDPLSLRVHFIVRLLRLAGFQPQLDECTGCGSAVHAPPDDSQGRGQAAGYWSARQGGLLCANCLHEDSKADVVTVQMLEWLSTLSEADRPPSIEAPMAAALRQRLDEFLRWRLDRPLKTMRV